MQTTADRPAARPPQLPEVPLRRAPREGYVRAALANLRRNGAPIAPPVRRRPKPPVTPR